ncbi:YDG SRA domain-containing [Pyrenophora seminiperda CCB06]|uniref:YDG SRA domain-containing n=1 Tax=Pyrenophora seminiperda CCB06 TaxID=1302712 RepID=A0A3M7LZ30_9PLEO|nr:YDG SRA domain-containing [Pyrenophora seminiperda CCB06]
MDFSGSNTDEKSFQAPAWIRTTARRTEKLAGVTPDVLATRLREISQIAPNGEDEQRRKCLLQERFAELGAAKHLELSRRAQEPEVARAGPEERHARKEQVRKTKMKEKTEKEANLKEITVRPCAVFAESSTAGALRESRLSTVAPSSCAMDMSGALFNKTDTGTSKVNSTPSNDLPVCPDEIDQYPIRQTLPKWYTSISVKHPRMEALGKKRPQELTLLDALKSCIQQCLAASPTHLATLHDNLRDFVHKAEILLPITPFVIRKANMLAPASGLPLIFSAQSTFPSDLQADSYQLYTRWCKGDFDQNILRGIETGKVESRTSDRISSAYRKKFPASARYYGQGDLVQGQWWPTQLCTVRDGAHGAPQGGIYGEKDGAGAYSIVLSGKYGCLDEDEGDVIYYSGTEGKNYTPTDNTLHLLKSLETGNPVRVLRSHQLAKKNPYRPEKGFRYDGLYTVIGVNVTDREKAMHRFKLVRCEGQPEIRYQGKSKRPTIWEVEAFEKLRKTVGFGGA